MRRERHTIFLCGLLLHRQFSTQPTRGARSAQIRLASPSSESQPSSSEAGTQLPAFSQISAHASGAWRHPSPSSNSYLGFLFWYLWMANPLCARVNTCVNVAPNPCAKRKVLSLTKPKGKIYKTKSLGNYITLLYMRNSVCPTIYPSLGGKQIGACSSLKTYARSDTQTDSSRMGNYECQFMSTQCSLFPS